MGTSERTAWRRINEVRAALARGFKAPEPEPAASWESVAYRTVLGEDGRHYRFVVRNGEAVEPMDKCEECGRALPAWSRNGRPPGRVCRPCRDKRRRSK
jgi:hypothetical protein